MTRLPVLALTALLVLLSACATPTESARTPGVQPPPSRSSVSVPVPKTDWPAERASIASALGGSSDITVVTRQDGTLQLVIPGAEAFARDGTDLKPGLRATLDRVATALAEKAETEILILGHTDGMGSELHNLRLSIRRAEAVTEYLRGRGIALTRLQADGRGESEPVADNGTEAGRAKNRRVEVIVRPFVR